MYQRFLIYSMRTNRPVRILLSDDGMRYVNMTVLSMDENSFLALKRGRKTPVSIPYDQVLAVSYARGDNGDTTNDLFNLK